MKLKGLLADKPAAYQLIILLSLILSGWVIASLISAIWIFSFHGINSNPLQEPELLRWLQLISVGCIFLVPSLAGAYLFSKNPKQYLYINTLPAPKAFLWIIGFMVLLSPIINMTALLNKELILPPFLEGVERWMQAKEAEAEALTELMLSGKGISTLLMNLLVIAVAAGITEEFFFRGSLQRIFQKWTTNHHITIWSVAFIFGAIHLQFYGLLPRTILGAFFGYLLYWTRNLWLPVFAHFINNAFGVIAMSREDWKENEFINGEIPPEMFWLYSIWAAISLVILYFCLQKFKINYKKETKIPGEYIPRE